MMLVHKQSPIVGPLHLGAVLIVSPALSSCASIFPLNPLPNNLHSGYPARDYWTPSSEGWIDMRHLFHHVQHFPQDATQSEILFNFPVPCSYTHPRIAVAT